LYSKIDSVIFNFVDLFYIFTVGLFKNVSSKVVIAHGVDVMLKWNHWYVRILKSMFLRRVQKIIAVSDVTSIYAIHSLPKSDSHKVTTIYNGICFDKLKGVRKTSKNFIKQELGINQKSKILLTVCNLVKRKGIDILLQADRLLMEDRIDFTHIIIGSGPEEASLMNLAKELRISDKVVFIKYVEADQELAKYFRASDLFLLMSKTIYEPPAMEGFGIVYVEAQYLGIPVIGGKSGGVSSAVRDSFTGYLIDPEDEHSHIEVYKAVKRLLSDGDLYTKMSTNAVEFAENRFSWYKFVEELTKYL
jgi:phosphatidylinositol alpha-1,6-mannosyltransferase